MGETACKEIKKTAKKTIKKGKKEGKCTKKTEKGIEKVKKIHKGLIKMLKDEGRYNPLLSHQAEHAARLKVVLDRMTEVILAGEEDFIEVSTSREGNERYRQNPMHQLYLQYMDRFQDSLKALGMNIDSKPVKKEERGIDDFLNTFRDND